ncbi:TonB-dependent receptor [Sphingobium algorifonticola]|nr:TonB-dependent receptor [Sphingobium algorifonticola]
MKTSALWIEGVSTAVLMVATATSSFAQSAGSAATSEAPIAADDDTTNSSGLRDIIVTAARRSERLQDVPIAVTAIDSEQLRNLNPRQLQDIQKIVPNFNVSQNQGVQSTFYSLRGIGSSNVRSATQASIGIFVDGVYQTSPVQSNTALLDIERVEVLRGPQGTLFGRNSMAGAIQIVTAKPGNMISGSAQAEYGERGLFNVNGNISGPIVNDTLYLSLAASHQEGGGSVFNPNTGSRADTNRENYRASIRLAPEGGAGSLTVTGTYGDILEVSSIADSNPFDYRQNGTTDQTVDGKIRGLAITGELDFGGAALTSISSYDYSAFRTAGDGDGTTAFLFTNSEYRRQRTMSQEVRLASNGAGPFKWLVGLYYYNESYFRRAGETINLAALAPPSIASPFPPAGSRLSVTFFPSATPTTRDTLKVETDNYAAFGEASLDVGQFIFTLGARYTIDEQRGTIVQPDNIGFGYGPLPPTLITQQLASTQTVNAKKFTPRGVISYKPSTDFLAYASVARGFKGGGFNTGLDPTSVTLFTLQPETVTNYEIGLKSSLFGNRLRLNAAAYYMQYNNLQVTQEINPALNLTGLVNAAKARIYGAEVEATWKVSDPLSLNLAIGYNNAQFEDYPNCVAERRNNAGVVTRSAENCAGKDLLQAPRWTVSGGFAYNRPISGKTTLLINGLGRYTGKNYILPTNTAVSEVGNYFVLDGGVGLGFLDGKFALELIGTNILNDRYRVFYQNSPFFGTIYQPSQKRTISVRGTARF